MLLHHAGLRLETKFANDVTSGEFEGYGAIFGNMDSHGDVIMPGAFADSLANRKSAGHSLPMYAEHGPNRGGDPLPVGVWHDVAEDGKGLKVRGQIASMDSDYGKRIYGLVKSGALGGLSIGFSVPPGGAVMGTKAGEPRRTLNKLNLAEISLVANPSNTMAAVQSLKTAAMSASDRDAAAASIAAAMRLHDKVMKGDSYSSGSSKDKALLMDHLRDAHEAITGMRAPADLEGWTKSVLQDAELKTALESLGAGLAGFTLA